MGSEFMKPNECRRPGTPATKHQGVSGPSWQCEPYNIQSRTIWPGRGQHILAQYDEDSIIVYQAYNSEIARYAVAHKRFTGCPAFKETRMTWIKTNFLWMCFRSDWASKPNQTNVLAIRLRRAAFDGYLANARGHGAGAVNIEKDASFRGTVRLQWDPDHLPGGERHCYRRAVQLGLRGVEGYIDGTDILDIVDISDFLTTQRPLAKAKNVGDDLMVAKERVYVPSISAKAVEAVGLSAPPSNTPSP